MRSCIGSIVLLFVLSGCSEPANVREFREATKTLIKEGRAGYKLFKEDNTEDAIERQGERITDAAAHVPEVPEQFRDSEQVAKLCRDVSRNYTIIKGSRQLASWAKITNATESIESTKTTLEEDVAALKKTIDELEAKTSK